MKKTIKIIGIGVLIGIALIIVQKTLAIPEKDFLKGYYLFGILIVFSAVGFNIFYNMLYFKRVQKAVVLLKEGKANDYIEQMIKLKSTAKGKALKQLLDINLSAGYCDLKQYDKAIALLEPLCGAKLKGEVKAVLIINLCTSYFHVNMQAKASELYLQNKDKLEKFKSMGKFTENILLLDIYYAAQTKDFESANIFIEQLKKQTTDESIIKELIEIQKSIDENGLCS